MQPARRHNGDDDAAEKAASRVQRMAHRVPVTKIDELVVRLIHAQHGPFGSLARFALRLVGVDFLGGAGRGLRLPHSTSRGLVANAGVRIGDDVTIYHGVTLGRADAHRAGGMDLTIGDGVFIGAGAVVLARSDRPMTIGAGATIGANAVVLTDVPAGETWAGSPARRVG
jgi:serine O-acetyltransferase